MNQQHNSKNQECFSTICISQEEHLIYYLHVLHLQFSVGGYKSSANHTQYREQKTEVSETGFSNSRNCLVALKHLPEKLRQVIQNSSVFKGTTPSLSQKQSGQPVKGSDSPHLLHSDEVPPGVLQQLLAFPTLEECNLLEQAQKRAMKMIKGLEHLSQEDRLRETGMLRLKRKRLQGNFTAPSIT